MALLLGGYVPVSLRLSRPSWGDGSEAGGAEKAVGVKSLVRDGRARAVWDGWPPSGQCF